ncbi:NAD(P)-dependent oxidoreductase [Actinokineospora enzanensis]|uniref:NAD(P)-dependent oxidoreductase n=1 Tax=Actinokineospora enzanensis TaxID=155975 RepID=UPI000367D53C|nr:NAD(P)-dependent oxidoreductase [Actinokineospora enzanensis]
MPGKVAVVGLGGMGAGMAAALLTAGFDVTVHNRTAAKAAPLAERGARVAESVGAAAAGVDIVVLSLSDETAVDAVLADLRPRPGTVVVDTSTVSVGFSRSAAARLAEQGVARVEACVVGNPRMANTGQLRVFTAGDESTVDKVRPVLDAVGASVTHLGAFGRSCAFKLALNLLLGVQTAALAEMVHFAESAGLDREQLLGTVLESGWSSPVLAFRAEFMRRRDYRPAAFRAELMGKDLRTLVAEAGAHGTALPVTESALRAYEGAVAAGRGDEDAAVVAELRG